MSFEVHPKKSLNAWELVQFIPNVSLSNKRYHVSQHILFLKPEFNDNLGEDIKKVKCNTL